MYICERDKEEELAARLVLSGVSLLFDIDRNERLVLLSIHSCRMRGYVDPVSDSATPTSTAVVSDTPDTTTSSKITFPNCKAVGSLFFRTPSGPGELPNERRFQLILSTRSMQDGDHRPGPGVVHMEFWGIHKRSFDEPFGRKFRNAPLDAQALLLIDPCFKFFSLALCGHS